MITILGATGFVGSALKARLTEEGKAVTGLSRPLFDLGKPETYSAIPEETKILVHSAGQAGPEHPADLYWRECVQATYDLVDFINRERKDIEKLIYISSGAVYKPSTAPLTETSELGPTNLYGMSRLLSENIISAKAKCPSVHLRLFFPYGSGQKSPRLIPELARKILSGEKIVLNNSKGSPKLNPIYIEDLTTRIVAILNQNQQGVFNIGGNEVVSIKDLALIIGNTLKKRPNFVTESNPSSDFYCDCEMESKFSLKSGLAHSLKQGDDNV